ncbi:[citrate (pro-3S)-lyase] ligase [Anaerococcus murdochii]|uniref:[Citrate [pro-3S]-lyase] ligase n=1 Tax=Anaerococcus murdochii TaxID=411577 RepID=A0ABS7SYL8_9FIRM|nr:[citrate (pro-3S)-lyase] ligase [Anaerococcus murdochii]MBZ2386619.1 [citrate (pro-3S)-lyase] ligase [Anaerococcus murdochii]
MNNYIVSEVYKTDKKSLDQVDRLLANEGIKRDKNTDYLAAIFDKGEVIATGCLFKNTLRSLAVDSSRQGEALMNTLISHLISEANSRGYYKLYLYAKLASAHFFKSLGFYEIARVDGVLCFMENEKNGFASYLDSLNKADKPYENVAGMVINANPFTKGHLYLVEKAAKENDLVHLFIVTDDLSDFDYKTRRELIIASTSHLDNIIYQECKDYLISSATFPSYFIKNEPDVIKAQARLDAEIFTKIAKNLGIKKRYIGTEVPGSTTDIYNQTLIETLPKAGIEIDLVERIKIKGEDISASRVRKLIKEANFDALKPLLPQPTYDFIMSERAQAIIKKIQNKS